MQHCFIGLTDSLHVWIWSTAADRSLPEAVKDRTTTTRQGKPRQLRCPTRSVVLWPPPGPPSAFGSRKSIILFAGAGLFVRSFLVRIKARANQAIRHLTYCVLLQMIGWRSDHSEGQNAGKSPEQSLAPSVARTFFCCVNEGESFKFVFSRILYYIPVKFYTSVVRASRLRLLGSSFSTSRDPSVNGIVVVLYQQNTKSTTIAWGRPTC